MTPQMRANYKLVFQELKSKSLEMNPKSKSVLRLAKLEDQALIMISTILKFSVQGTCLKITKASAYNFMIQ